MKIDNLTTDFSHRERSRQENECPTQALTDSGYVGAEIERARLETENLQLSDRLESRKVIDQAKGVLQRYLKVSEDEAYRTMQKESRQRRRSMREIAEAILLSENPRIGRRAGNTG